MAIPDAATVAQRWVNAAGAAQQRFTEGVQATTKDPTALAIAQVQKLQANFIQAVTSGRWQRNLAKAGKAGWQAATVAKAGNYGTGIAASQDKFAAAMAPVLAIEAQLQAAINAMPNATLADSIARSAAWQTGLYNWKRSR
jgi:prophage DNA circulation protein